VTNGLWYWLASFPAATEKETRMAIPERDTVYSNDGTNRTVYSRESTSTGWFVGIIVALALLAIGYLVFSANSGPTVDDYKSMIGAKIVDAGKQGVAYQLPDGSCVLASYAEVAVFWKGTKIACPAEPSTTVEAPAN